MYATLALIEFYGTNRSHPFYIDTKLTVLQFLYEGQKMFAISYSLYYLCLCDCFSVLGVVSMFLCLMWVYILCYNLFCICRNINKLFALG